MRAHGQFSMGLDIRNVSNSCMGAWNGISAWQLARRIRTQRFVCMTCMLSPFQVTPPQQVYSTPYMTCLFASRSQFRQCCAPLAWRCSTIGLGVAPLLLRGRLNLHSWPSLHSPLPRACPPRSAWGWQARVGWGKPGRMSRVGWGKRGWKALLCMLGLLLLHLGSLMIEGCSPNSCVLCLCGKRCIARPPRLTWPW